MKQNSLSLLRVIATIMVVMVHFGQSLPLPDYIHKGIMFGQYGVIVFFILSGYWICTSLNKNENLSEYYIKRIYRIVPAYYAVVILNMIIWCMFSYNTFDLNILKWLRYFTFSHCIFPTDDWIMWNNCAALWTMCAFAVFYLMAPILNQIMFKKRYRIISLVLAGGENSRCRYI